MWGHILLGKQCNKCKIRVPLHWIPTSDSSPFNNLESSIEKDLADAVLLRCSTLALGLVEKGILVWAPQLASLRV